MLFYAGADINALSRRMATREWWESERRQFRIIASSITERELEAGAYAYQEEALQLVRRLNYVPITQLVRRLAAEFLDGNVVPPNKPGDAAQLAIATAHQIDYLLTWNYAHLANPATQLRGHQVAAKHQLRMPWLVSPETIPQTSLGQSIRRLKDE
ncbi:MAG: hypothetical protein H7062_00135 [Candidatus Saccharimonas sp.]|nr:hypothetical protein [Planctomycetaceae bacterium]